MLLEDQKRTKFMADPNIIELNVGGEIFATTVNTLGREDSILLRMVSGTMTSRRDKEGRLFLDRDPTHFRWILNYLRDGYLTTLPASAQDRAELLHEARCFHVQGLIGIIEAYNPHSAHGNSSGSNNNSHGDAMSSESLTTCPTFLTARPSSKGVFFYPDFKWDAFGCAGVKESVDVFGVRFEDGKDEVTFCALLADQYTGSYSVECVCQSKLILDPKARAVIAISENPAENPEALFWWEPSNTQYPQLFGKIFRGEHTFISRGLDFFRTSTDEL